MADPRTLPQLAELVNALEDEIARGLHLLEQGSYVVDIREQRGSEWPVLAVVVSYSDAHASLLWVRQRARDLAAALAGGLAPLPKPEDVMREQNCYRYVREAYGVPAYIGVRVNMNKRLGTLVKANSALHYLHVLFDDLKYDVPVHPKDVNYLDVGVGEAPPQTEPE